MDPASINGQIDRILHSQSFASKGQLRKLLEILHKNMDSQATLKPEGVIRELWPNETRTKSSADVATEINRLRRALEAYYRSEGETDPIVITLPNRAAAGTEGAHEKRWISATERGAEQPNGSSAIEKSRRLPSLITAAAGVAALAVLAFASSRLLAGDNQPHAGRLEGSTLAIVNAEGKPLWSKSFSEGFDYATYYAQGLGPRIWFGDLEGEGHTSVLFLYFPNVKPEMHSSTLICYSDSGKEKWRWTPGRVLPELEGSPATFRTQAMAVLKATATRPQRIVVSSTHVPWYPDQIAILDAHGKTLSEYWHSGHLNTLVLADLDGNGKEEIVASGISNGYRQATLVVLDPEHVSGASAEPERPELQIHGMGEPQEMLRLLFPRSDMNQAASVYNIGQEVSIDHGRIRMAVRECQQLGGCLIWYEFDSHFHLLSAVAADQFREAHAAFYRSGKDAHAFSAAEEAEFQKVRCVVGCKTEFVASQIRPPKSTP